MLGVTPMSSRAVLGHMSQVPRGNEYKSLREKSLPCFNMELHLLKQLNGSSHCAALQNLTTVAWVATEMQVWSPAQELLQRCGFSPLPGTFHMPWGRPLNKQKTRHSSCGLAGYGPDVSVRIWVQSLTLLSGLRIHPKAAVWIENVAHIWCWCGCGIGWQLQLLFDP